MQNDEQDREIERLLPLSGPIFQILLALVEGERHGYAIMQDVAEGTKGAVRLGPGTLYGAIKRSLKEGLIMESVGAPAPTTDDQRRRYYQITPWGRQVASAEAERLVNLVRTAATKGLIEDTALAELS